MNLIASIFFLAPWRNAEPATSGPVTISGRNSVKDWNSGWSNDRPVGVSFPARDHEDATARDSFDVMININDEGD